MHAADMNARSGFPASPHSLLLADMTGGEWRAIGAYLEQQGLKVSHTDCPAGAEGFGAVMLVARLPDPAVLAAIRRLGDDGPPVMVAALDGEALERVVALEMGADDLVGRDVEPREILARLHRMMRRRPVQSGAGPTPTPVPVPVPVPARPEGAWSLRAAQRVLATPTGRRVWLSGGDQDLLKAFVASEDGLILERDYPRGHIRTAISRLKRRVLQGADTELPIQNVWGQGYRFDADLVQA